MSEFDFDETASLWQAEPTEEEQRVFRSLARRASRMARLAELAEVGIGLVLAAALVIAALIEPAPATIVICALAIGAILWSSWKRHLLHQVALIIDTGARETLLETALQSARASLRRSTIGLVLLLPSFLLGALLKHSYMNRGQLRNFGEGTWDHIRSSASAVSLLAIFLVCVIFIVRTNLRLRSEVRRIERLRRQYVHEAKFDRSSSD